MYQCHYSWANTGHTVCGPSRTRWDVFQSSCLDIVSYARRHSICFDLEALINTNTMLVILAFTDSEVSLAPQPVWVATAEVPPATQPVWVTIQSASVTDLPATQPFWVTPVSQCDWFLTLQPLNPCEWLQSASVTGPWSCSSASVSRYAVSQCDRKSANASYPQSHSS